MAEQSLTKRTPPEAAIAEAKNNPGGWVYQIHGPYQGQSNVPPEAIEGAWRVGDDGFLTGDFLPNPNFKPPSSLNQRSQRYDGKPLVRIQECYVLWAIGKLGERDAAEMQKYEPKLQALYKDPDVWQNVLARAMGFPQDMREAVLRLWQKNVDKFRVAGFTPDPQAFAEAFVDANFSPDMKK